MTSQTKNLIQNLLKAPGATEPQVIMAVKLELGTTYLDAFYMVREIKEEQAQ